MHHDIASVSLQSRVMSFVEAVTNVVVGFAVALATQAALFPRLGLEVAMMDNLLIGAVFTIVSLLRSYALRRLFEAIRTRKPSLDSFSLNKRTTA